MIIHPLHTTTPYPQQFTNPFDYKPSEVVLLAAEELMRYLKTQSTWHSELYQGKMFGVLVVQNAQGELGFLAAFSGNLAGQTLHPYFVPPIFNIHAPDSFFRNKEQRITAINEEIKTLSTDSQHVTLLAELHSLKEQCSQQIQEYRAYIKTQKESRHALRQEHLPQEKRAELILQSQFQKAELKRIEQRNRDSINALENKISTYTNQIEELKRLRQQLSQELQKRLFESYIVLNGHNESLSLLEIFQQSRATPPPAGAGECAAPKLLNWAYRNNLTPISMGEFWWGESPRLEVRHHGEWYTACKSKCEPILGFMLQGLDIESPSTDYSAKRELKLLYHDKWLAVVDKPAGMLSVKGRDNTPSVEALLSKMFPQNSEAKPAHRLDMDTSGILLIALDRATYSKLQRQFSQREIKKIYIALLDGLLTEHRGEINLPLSADYENRPRQRVDHHSGREAITRYSVVSVHNGKTKIQLEPITGRTHQLRLHAAHKEGLNTPITGDRLYGHRAQRLMLHAQQITLRHPVTEELITLFSKEEF